MAIREFQCVMVYRRRVGGIEWTIAIGVWMIRAGGTSCATLGIGLSDDNGLVTQLRKTRDDLETAGNTACLISHAHLHATVQHARVTFGVEPNVVQRRSVLAGGEILAAHGVLQKIVQKCSRLRRCRPGGMWPSDARLR